jgi:hypothetical protein
MNGGGRLCGGADRDKVVVAPSLCVASSGVRRGTRVRTSGLEHYRKKNRNLESVCAKNEKNFSPTDTDLPLVPV